jgi:integrase
MSDNSHLSDPPNAKRGVSTIADICKSSLNAKRRKTAETWEKEDLEGAAEAQKPRNSVDFYLAQSQARNTRKAYRSDLEQFEAWGGVIPASPEQLASYLAENAAALTVSTLKRRVAAVAWAHRDQRLDDPSKSSLVKQVLKGIGRHHGEKQKQASPLLLEQLERIVVGLGHTHKDRRDKALLLVGFYGAFRGSELLSLRVEDCAFNEDGALLHLAKSKTDQAARGRWVAIPRLADPACPTLALEDWVAECGPEAGLLFRPLNGAPSGKDSSLSVRSLSRVIQQRISQIGLDPHGFSSHSLRAGFVTSQMNLGVDASAIARQTGHRSLDILKRYDRPLTAGLSTTPERFGELFSGSRTNKEVCDLSRQSVGDPLKHSNSGIFEATLQPADIGPINPSIHRQGLLREALGNSKLPKIVSNDTLNLHAVKSPSCR